MRLSRSPEQARRLFYFRLGDIWGLRAVTRPNRLQ